MLHELAGKPAPASILIDLNAVKRAYYEKTPDISNPTQLVSFGTSGHRGRALDGTFTEPHILAVAQAVCDYRAEKNDTGPLFLGKDTHYLSDFAQKTALEVFATNKINVVFQKENGFTPTPVISHAILRYNKNRKDGFADGVIITPSHNPPSDGGIKYNGPNGGPADSDVTSWIETRANQYLKSGVPSIKRIPYDEALKSSSVTAVDYAVDYVADLENVIDMQAIADAKLKLGVDPLGGAAVHYWKPIREKYGLDITVVNPNVDPRFGFMTVDHDGKIRMDCSSPYAMQSLVALKDQFDLAFANDPDSDRHGIIAPSVGLMNPNHYLTAAIAYLYGNSFARRPNWPKNAGVGKTAVSSSIIDRLTKELGVPLYEVPVGFKWFVDPLFKRTICFGGEESAGASLLRKDGSVWTTDKDGIILNLLAAEILAVTKKDPGVLYKEIEGRLGTSVYTRVDEAVSPTLKAAFKRLTPEKVTASQLAGDPITAKLTNAPGNGASIGGLKIVTAEGWFAARPSGTEDIYKIYAESFRGTDHLNAILSEAKKIVSDVLK